MGERTKHITLLTSSSSVFEAICLPAPNVRIVLGVFAVELPLTPPRTHARAHTQIQDEKKKP